MNNKILLLDKEDIMRKCQRMAFQIWEFFIDEKIIHVIGIKKCGSLFAKILQNELLKISNLEIQFHEIEFDKEKPLDSNIQLDFDANNQCILLVDDVANSGSTLMYALKPFIDAYPKNIKVAVLVDRKHKRFPITADIVGEKLSTTLQSRVSVLFDENGHPEGAYLES